MIYFQSIKSNLARRANYRRTMLRVTHSGRPTISINCQAKPTFVATYEQLFVPGVRVAIQRCRISVISP